MRIVAGRFGGRRLTAPPGSRTRPTTDRVREALFSILGASVAGARVADLFAGTGALGLEALSRGAASADFYEAAPAARRALMTNVQALGVSEVVTVHGGRLPGALRAGAVFDLVLIDPPWERGFGVPTLATLLERGLLAEEGQVVLEERHGHQPSVEDWREVGLGVSGERRYGDTALVFLERL